MRRLELDHFGTVEYPLIRHSEPLQASMGLTVGYRMVTDTVASEYFLGYLMC